MKTKGKPNGIEKLLPCRACGQAIAVTPGLAEMEEHWTLDHPDELAEMRRKLGHDEEEE